MFPWAASVTLLVVPVMTADFSERYALIAMPAICLAAALAFAPRDPGGPPRQAAAKTPEEMPATTSEELPAGPATPAAAPAARPGRAPGESDARQSANNPGWIASHSRPVGQGMHDDPCAQ